MQHQIGTPMSSMGAGQMPSMAYSGGIPSTDAFLGHGAGGAAGGEFFIGSMPPSSMGPGPPMTRGSQIGVLDGGRSGTFDPGNTLASMSEVGALDARLTKSASGSRSLQTLNPSSPASAGGLLPVPRSKSDPGGIQPGTQLQTVFSPPSSQAGSAMVAGSAASMAARSQHDWRSSDWGVGSIAPPPPPQAGSPTTMLPQTSTGPATMVPQSSTPRAPAAGNFQEAVPTFSGVPAPSQASMVPLPPPAFGGPGAHQPPVPTIFGSTANTADRAVPGTPGFPPFTSGPLSTFQSQRQMLPMSGAPDPTPPGTRPLADFQSPPPTNPMSRSVSTPSMPAGTAEGSQRNSVGSARASTGSAIAGAGKVWSAKDLAATLPPVGASSPPTPRGSASMPPALVGSASVPMAGGGSAHFSAPPSAAGSAKVSMPNGSAAMSVAPSANASVLSTHEVPGNAAGSAASHTGALLQSISTAQTGTLSAHTFGGPEQLVPPGSLSLVGVTATGGPPLQTVPPSNAGSARVLAGSATLAPGSAHISQGSAFAPPGSAHVGSAYAPYGPPGSAHLPGSVRVPASMPASPEKSEPPPPPYMSAPAETHWAHQAPGSSETLPSLPDLGGDTQWQGPPGPPDAQVLPASTHFGPPGPPGAQVPPASTHFRPQSTAPPPPYLQQTEGHAQAMGSWQPHTAPPAHAAPAAPAADTIDQRLAALEQNLLANAARPNQHHMPDAPARWSPTAVAAAEAVLAAEAAQAVAAKASNQWSAAAHAAAEAVMEAEIAKLKALEEEMRDWRHFIEPPKNGLLFGEKYCRRALQGGYVPDCFVDMERIRHREVDLVYRRATNLKVVEEDLPFITWLAGVDKKKVHAQSEVIDSRSWRGLPEFEEVPKSKFMGEAQ